MNAHIIKLFPNELTKKKINFLIFRPRSEGKSSVLSLFLDTNIVCI